MPFRSKKRTLGKRTLGKRTYKKKSLRRFHKKVYKKVPRHTYASSVEKKFIETRTQTTALNFAKDNGSVSGHLLFQFDKTSTSNVNAFFPRIVKGTNQDDRIGNEIKLTGLSLICRVSGQGQNKSGGQYRIIIFGKKHVSCQQPDVPNLLQELLDLDRMENNDRYTVSSQRNPEFYRQFVVFYNKKFTLRGDMYDNNRAIPTGTTPATYTPDQQDNFRDHMINIKLNRSCKYDRKQAITTHTTMTYGDLAMVVLANKGDIAQQTGFEWNHFCKWYYTDS